MKPSFKLHRALSAWLCLVALTSVQLGNADDLDIYTSISGNSSNSANHNILFVMDTSGSMDEPAAGLATGGDYDPNTDYGDSADAIYVYDRDFNFTGETISYAQNSCKSMTNIFNSNTSYPIYLDKILQWQESTNIIDGGQTCDAPTVEGTEVSGSDRLDKSKKTKTLESFDIDENSQYSITISTNKSITLSVRSERNKNNSRYSSQCRNTTLSGGGSITCTGTADSDHDELKILVKVSSDNTRISYEGEINITASDSCTDNPDIVVTNNDWKSNLASNSTDNNIVECLGDADYHGLNDSSEALYVAECAEIESDNDCDSPAYSSDSSDEINWDTSDVQYFIPANYHDYLLNYGNIDSDDIIDEPQDADDYCDSDNHIGDIFIDEDSGLIYECFHRIDIMKIAVANIVGSLQNSPINIGLMRFSGGSGGTIVDAVESISTNTDFTTALEALPASGSTPLSEVLYEAYRYYAGLEPLYGVDCSGYYCSYTTDPDATNGDNYRTPITESCQSNNIILLSDGEPTSDGGSNSSIRSVAGVSSCNGNNADNCLDEMAGAMATQDMNINVAGTNTVKTYTVGLSIDLPLLEEAARKGGGEYYTANDTSQLQQAFQNIILDILTDSSSFVAPAVSVNAFNELQHRSEIYYAVFEPSGTPRWAGNIKKYSISQDGKILDANGSEAIDATTGFFKESAQSFWSSVADGRTVTLGGVAEKLSNDRNVYTENSEGDLIKLTSSNLDEISNSAVNAGSDNDRDNILKWLMGQDRYDDNRNSNTTEAAKFHGDPLHSRPAVVTYGGNSNAPEDVLFFLTNLGTLHAVDPLTNKGTELWTYLPSEHQDNAYQYINAPNTTVHTYGLDGQLTIVTEEADDSTSSNYAVESVKLYFGERRGGSRYYAIDASNARIDANPSSQPDSSSTAPFKKMWTITGAMPGSPGTTAKVASADSGFKDMAQTWDSMIPTKIKYSDGESDVLIFSGGYDPKHDSINSTSLNTDADYGNAIYIVDADTGNLLFSIGNNTPNDGDTNLLDPLLPRTSNRDIDTHDLNLPMRDSIVAAPSVLDINNDGYADLIFAIDIMGHIWRVDLDSSEELGSDYASGGLIFDLSSNSASGHKRRFYNSIDLSLSDPRSGSNHINLAVGSGYRPSPNHSESGWLNQFYLLFDDYPFTRELSDEDEPDRYNYFAYDDDGTTAYRTVSHADLVEASFDTPVYKQTKRTDENGEDTDFGINGIYFNFDAKEKLLQSSITFNQRIAFSTYYPDAESASACGSSSIGGGRIYVLDLLTGLSVFETTDENGDKTPVEFLELKHPGIPPPFTPILTPKVVWCAGTECSDGVDEDDESPPSGIDLGADAINDGFVNGRAYKTFWREN